MGLEQKDLSRNVENPPTTQAPMLPKCPHLDLSLGAVRVDRGLILQAGTSKAEGSRQAGSDQTSSRSWNAGMAPPGSGGLPEGSGSRQTGRQGGAEEMPLQGWAGPENHEVRVAMSQDARCQNRGSPGVSTQGATLCPIKKFGFCPRWQAGPAGLSDRDPPDPG